MTQFAWPNLVWIGIGGGLGAMARYLASIAVHHAVPGFKPLGTMFVNVLGCLLVGMIMQIVIKTETSGTPIHFFLVTGILGGFTTFSAFGYETVVLWQQKQPGWMLLNIGGNLACGLLAVLLGQVLADWWWK